MPPGSAGLIDREADEQGESERRARTLQEAWQPDNLLKDLIEPENGCQPLNLKSDMAGPLRRLPFTP